MFLSVCISYVSCLPLVPSASLHLQVSHATVIIFTTFLGLFSSQRRESDVCLLVTTHPNIFKDNLGWNESPSVLTPIFH